MQVERAGRAVGWERKPNWVSRAGEEGGQIIVQIKYNYPNLQRRTRNFK